MPEGVGYGPQNTASTGLNLNVIGNHAYAFTGEVNSTQSGNTVIDFISGSFYFVGNFNVLTTDISGDDMVMVLSFNGVTILSQNYPSQFYRSIDATVGLIIPPYTEVKVTFTNPTSATNRTYSMGITGRIYK